MTSVFRVGAVSLFALVVSSGAAVAARPPNIIVILADDLGMGDVSCCNPESAWRTPSLDRLAGDGMLFTDAHSSSAVCTPTRYSLLTGRYAWRTRLKESVLQGYSPPLIEPGRLTLPEFLRRQGYVTAMLGKWHLGLDWGRTGPKPEAVDFAMPVGGGPKSHGFDHFFGIAASLDMPPYVWIENDRVTAVPDREVGDGPAPRYWRAGPIGADFRMEEVQPRLTARTIAYLGERALAGDGKPFFLFLSLAAPHTPILPASDFSGRTPSAYGDFVVQVDADVGSILDALDQHGLTRDTLLIVTSDNGFSPVADLPKHRSFGHDPSGGFRGAKTDAFEGGHRIPFIARWPGVIPAGTRCAEVVGQLDLFATCAEVLGKTLPEDVAEDSFSMLPLLRGENAPATRRSSLVHHSGQGSFAIREGNWKLILDPGSGGWGPPTRLRTPWSRSAPDSFTGLPPFQLYDLASDPVERVNLVEKHPEIVRRLGRLARDTIDRGRSTPGPVQANAAGPWPQAAWRDQFR